MEQWEYLSIFVEADTKDKQIKQFVEETFSKKAKRHSPEALIPELNKLGKDGWEMVHMEPIARVSGKESIRFEPYRWTNTYFCVFKRAIPQPELPAAMMAQVVESEPDVEIPPIQLNPNMPY